MYVLSQECPSRCGSPFLEGPAVGMENYLLQIDKKKKTKEELNEVQPPKIKNSRPYYPLHLRVKIVRMIQQQVLEKVEIVEAIWKVSVENKIDPQIIADMWKRRSKYFELEEQRKANLKSKKHKAKKLTFKCSKCQQKMDSKENLERHTVSEHNHVCEKCGSVFDNEAKLASHDNKKHQKGQSVRQAEGFSKGASESGSSGNNVRQYVSSTTIKSSEDDEVKILNESIVVIYRGEPEAGTSSSTSSTFVGTCPLCGSVALCGLFECLLKLETHAYTCDSTRVSAFAFH